MNSYRSLLMAFACAWLAGCQGGVETDILERQLRIQEDRIYQLQDYIESYQSRLDKCHCGRAPAAATSVNKRSFKSTPQLAAPEEFAPPADDPEDDSFAPPAILPGTPAEPGTGTPQTSGLQGGNIVPASFEADVDEIVVEGPPTQLTVRGKWRDLPSESAAPAERVILAVVEPRTDEGALLAIPGEVSLMVIDTSQRGPAAQLARWDFSPEQAADLWLTSRAGTRLHVELPWSAPIESGPLQLWARLITADGQKLLANSDLRSAERTSSPPQPKDAKPADADADPVADAKLVAGAELATGDGFSARQGSDAVRPRVANEEKQPAWAVTSHGSSAQPADRRGFRRRTTQPQPAPVQQAQPHRRPVTESESTSIRPADGAGQRRPISADPTGSTQRTPSRPLSDPPDWKPFR